MLAGLILYELKFRTHLLFLEYSWKLGFPPQKFIMTGKNKTTTYTNLNLFPKWEVSYFLQIPADAFPTYVSAFSHCLRHGALFGMGWGGSHSCHDAVGLDGPLLELAMGMSPGSGCAVGGAARAGSWAARCPGTDRPQWVQGLAQQSPGAVGSLLLGHGAWLCRAGTVGSDCWAVLAPGWQGHGWMVWWHMAAGGTARVVPVCLVT